MGLNLNTRVSVNTLKVKEKGFYPNPYFLKEKLPLGKLSRTISTTTTAAAVIAAAVKISFIFLD
jgi:hypothetical protein